MAVPFNGKDLVLGVGHSHFPHRTAPLIALDRGYFAEEGFGKVDVLVSGDDDTTMRALLAGDIHVGLDIAPIVALKARNEGHPVFIIGAMVNGLGFFLMAKPEIKTIKDLAGRRIQVVETGGGIDERQVRVLLAKNGIDPDKDVIFVRKAPFPLLRNAKAAFDQDVADARMVLNVDLEEARDAGYPILYDFFAEYPAGYPQRSIMATQDFIEANADRLKAFLRAMVRAYRFMRLDRNYKDVMAVVRKNVTEPNLGLPAHIPADFLDKPFFAFKQSPADGAVSLDGLDLYIAERVPPDQRTIGAADLLHLALVKEVSEGLDRRYGKDAYEPMQG